jgi:hypothetical protein
MWRNGAISWNSSASSTKEMSLPNSRRPFYISVYETWLFIVYEIWGSHGDKCVDVGLLVRAWRRRQYVPPKHCGYNPKDWHRLCTVLAVAMETTVISFILIRDMSGQLCTHMTQVKDNRAAMASGWKYNLYISIPFAFINNTALWPSVQTKIYFYTLKIDTLI